MNQITELTVDECLTLLRSRTVGRIALTTPAGLRIFPVNFSVVGEDVVFRTLPYGVIANNAHQAQVAFEVDDLDEATHAGWSVVAAGRCHRIEDVGEVNEVRRGEDPEPWAAGQRILYFRVEWEELSGRRVGAPQPATAVPQPRQGPAPSSPRSAAAPPPAPPGARR